MTPLVEKMYRWFTHAQKEYRPSVLVIALHANGSWQTTEVSDEAWHKLPSDKIGALVFMDLKNSERYSKQ